MVGEAVYSRGNCRCYGRNNAVFGESMVGEKTIRGKDVVPTPRPNIHQSRLRAEYIILASFLKKSNQYFCLKLSMLPLVVRLVQL